MERHGRVAVMLPPGPQLAVASVAVAAAAACAPLNPSYPAAEYEYALRHFKIGTVLVQSGVQSAARAVAEQQGIPLIELIPTHEAEVGLFTLQGADQPRRPHSDAPTCDDIALLLSTSGTTSRPKTVPLTHANVCLSALNISRALMLGESDRCLNVMPLFHIHGLMVTLSSLVAGGSVVCAQTPEVG